MTEYLMNDRIYFYNLYILNIILKIYNYITLYISNTDMTLI